MINFVINILISLLGGFIISAIITTIITQHIATYCKKINVVISELNEKSLLGTPVPANENRKILEKYTSKLLIIYTAVSAIILLFIIYT